MVGCGSKTNQVKNILKVSDYQLSDDKLEIDRLGIIAIDAYDRKDFKTATNYYTKLYDKTDDVIYASRAIHSAVIVKDFDTVGKVLEKVSKKDQRTPEIDRYLVAYHIDKKEFVKANKLALKLIKKDKTAKNLELVALSYEGLKEYDKALKFYEEAYQDKKEVYSLLKIFDILYLKTDKKQKAIRLFETHTALYGCDKIICSRLLQHYAYKQDSYNVERILKTLYKKSKDPLYAKKLIQFYAANKSYDKAIEFLKESKFDDLLLLDMYTSKKDYKSAMKLADKLYDEKKEPSLLARSAILEYESSHSKNSKQLLESVSKKFENVIKELDDPLYYNYYGYLLIDHDIDVDRGMELVKKALKVEPDSPFYIDSIAWGMYKKDDCQGAYTLLKPIAEKEKEKEIQDHFKIIKKCIEDKK
jgi:tetratricopeptide (TPR) repeat protein